MVKINLSVLVFGKAVIIPYGNVATSSILDAKSYAAAKINSREVKCELENVSPDHLVAMHFGKEAKNSRIINEFIEPDTEVTAIHLVYKPSFAEMLLRSKTAASEVSREITEESDTEDETQEEGKKKKKRRRRRKKKAGTIVGEDGEVIPVPVVVPKAYKQPIMLSDMFSNQPVTQTKSEKQVKVLRAAGPRMLSLGSSAAVTQHTMHGRHQSVGAAKGKLTVNRAAGTAIVISKGKKRLGPSVPHPSSLKKVILRERKERYLKWQRDHSIAFRSDAAGGDNTDMETDNEQPTTADSALLPTETSIELSSVKQGNTPITAVPVKSEGLRKPKGRPLPPPPKQTKKKNDSLKELIRVLNKQRKEKGEPIVSSSDRPDNASDLDPSDESDIPEDLSSGEEEDMRRHIEQKRLAERAKREQEEAERLAAYTQAKIAEMKELLAYPHVPCETPSREYCDQLLSKDLDTVVQELLHKLKGFQDRVKEREPQKARMKMRYVCGLKQVYKSLLALKAKAVILAPNIEKITALGGLDEYVQKIINECQSREIPIIYALKKRKIGAALRVHTGISAVSILMADGAHEQFKEMVTLAEKLREDYIKQQQSGPTTTSSDAPHVVDSKSLFASGASTTSSASPSQLLTVPPTTTATTTTTTTTTSSKTMSNSDTSGAQAATTTPTAVSGEATVSRFKAMLKSVQLSAIPDFVPGAGKK